MRKFLFLFLAVAGFQYSFAQAPTLQQKLYYTCKVWGFVKYYHSGVSVCSVNWDSVLLQALPRVEAAATDSAFNDALDTMLAAAGPMTLSTTYFPDTLPANLKFNRDWTWISTAVLRTDVQVQLDTIKNNFRPHGGCWVENNYYTTSYNGWLILPYDNPELNMDTYTSYPDEDHRLLMFFKYWNVVRYFYPYNYALFTPWDTTLSDFVVPMANVGDPQSLYLMYLQIATRLSDAHVYGLTYSEYYQNLPGYYMPLLRLQYVDSQYVVVKSSVAGINVGDAIISSDGLTGSQWEDSLKPYFSSGNMSVFRRSVCESKLGRQTYGISETLIVEDSAGTDHTIIVGCNSSPSANPAFFGNYIYPADSLDKIYWTTLPCNIGYVNMGNLQDSSVPTMYADLRNKSAIIFDIRNYPNGTAWDIADLMYPSAMPFAGFTIPDTSYPGTYSWELDSLGYNGNPDAYAGKVIILMNEQTQSQAEFSCMILGAMPGSIKVGSQTAGTDGNVSYWNLSQDLYTGFTTLGTFYPNGDSTEHIGIVPDSVVSPTRDGIRHGDDEVLDKALAIAGCYLSVPAVVAPNPRLQVFPNPTEDQVNVLGVNITPGKVTIQLTDLTGKVLIERVTDNSGKTFSATLNVAGLSAGMYFVTVTTCGGQFVNKVIKN